MIRSAVTCAALACCCTAHAHPVTQGAMEITIANAQVSVRARVSPEEVVVENMHAQRPAAELADAYQQHGQYLLKHLRIFADDHELSGKLEAVSPPSGAGNAQVAFDFLFPVSKAPQTLRLEENVLNEFDYAPGNRWEASYVVSVRAAERALVSGALLTSTSPLTVTASSRPSVWRTARDYVRHGITHILTGYDHLLFIAALALAVTTLWELFKIIAAFTLAHSITLTLSVLDIIRLPSQIVEPMIAASIVFVALQNVFWPRRSRGAARLLVAFFFGLFHGLGFAGGLLNAMSGMPGVAVSVAIVCFSLGVELGHQCVVLPLFALTKLVRTSDGERAGEWLLRGGSAIISAAGMFYFAAAVTQLSLHK